MFENAKTLGKLAGPFYVERTVACRGERIANLVGSGRIVSNKKYFRDQYRSGHCSSYQASESSRMCGKCP
jgi:hypothetical protein